MSMQEMVDNLTRFKSSYFEATSILSSLIENFTSQKANLLARELQKVLGTKRFSETRMPELAIRIRVENQLWN